MFVDIDGFVDTAARPLHVDLDILFEVDSVGGDGAITVFDSDRSTIDAAGSLFVSYVDGESIEVQLDQESTALPDYSIGGVGVELVDWQLPSSTIDIELTGQDDVATVQGTNDPNVTLLSLATAGRESDFFFESPTDEISIDARQGDDALTLDTLDESFLAVPSFVGGDGSDSLDWNAELSVGAVGQARDLTVEVDPFASTGMSS